MCVCVFSPEKRRKKIYTRQRGRTLVLCYLGDYRCTAKEDADEVRGGRKGRAAERACIDIPPQFARSCRELSLFNAWGELLVGRDRSLCVRIDGTLGRILARSRFIIFFFFRTTACPPPSSLLWNFLCFIVRFLPHPRRCFRRSSLLSFFYELRKGICAENRGSVIFLMFLDHSDGV